MGIAVTWLVAGAFFVFIEAMGVSGVGFLFAGLAAITTGGLLQAEIIAPWAYLTQGAVFLVSCFFWAAVLWRPLKKFQKRNVKTEYSNIIGETAIVFNKPLIKGRVGEVKWSGTVMQAVLAENSREQHGVPPESVVTIIGVEGNILKVKA